MRWIELISGPARVDPLLRGVGDRELDASRIIGRVLEGTGGLPGKLVEAGAELDCNIGDGVDEVVNEVGDVRNAGNPKGIYSGLLTASTT
jgi:hypothetical protein